jgi:chromosome segregation protein
VVAGESKKEQAGILQRKLQIEKLNAAIERSKKDHAIVVHDKDICIINRDEAKKALVEVDEKLNKGQRHLQEQQTSIKHYETEVAAGAEKSAAIAAELGEINKRIASLEAECGQCEASVAEQQGSYDGLEKQVEAARAGVRAREEERNAKLEHIKHTELEVQGLTNRVDGDRQDVERLKKENTRSFERKQLKIEERQKASAEIADIERSQVTLKAGQDSLLAQRQELENVRDRVREEYNSRLVEIDELRKAVKTEQTEFEEMANQIHTIELEVTRDEQEVHRIRERMWEAHEVDISSPSQPLPELTEPEPEVTEQIELLKERIKRVGEVNMAAFEDYETESKRLAELTVQRDDLQKAVDDLDHAIRKLDKEARSQFLATFEQVQRYFGDMFTTLFEGGEANLQLEENADPLEATIHINVRPAGKKMRVVQMLSAGERALTAISLLFALYLVKPSAYCILDELDAPLDEANTVRFLTVLRKFSGNTQFIVITHNKRTMETADVLYGVTQRESGVSTIVSVKFEEAVRQAA